MSSLLRLLIIDDRPESVAGIAGILGDIGHRVEIEQDPIMAMKRIQNASRDPYQLLLVDVNLPGIDGPGLIRELRLRGVQTPAILTTGYQSVAGRVRGDLANLKALAVLTKPIQQGELATLLERVAKTIRGSTQSPDRRISEGGLGSGGHPLVGGNVPGGGDDIPFYGTSRTFRAKPSSQAPSEGVLSRVQRPPTEDNIIPDHVVTGRSTNPVRQPPGQPRGSRTPLGNPTIPGRPATNPGEDSSGFFPTSIDAPPPGVTGSGSSSTRRTPLTGLGDKPLTTYRDPVTGNYKRQPSGLLMPDPNMKRSLSEVSPPETERPGTTSRFRRSLNALGGQPPGPPTTGGQPITSRIRRGVTSAPPPPSAPEDQTTCMVACAHCQGQFTVLIKSEAYTVMCVHCGQLNRIDPL
jgi:CheY-like chemotaxis protein